MYKYLVGNPVTKISYGLGGKFKTHELQLLAPSLCALCSLAFVEPNKMLHFCLKVYSFLGHLC